MGYNCLENLYFCRVNRWRKVRKNCPSHGECLRYMAGQQSPESLRYHLCIVPQAVQGNRCELFQPAEPVRVAYGSAIVTKTC